MCIKSSKSNGIESVRLSGINGDNETSSSSSISGSNGMTKTCSGDAFGVEWIGCVGTPTDMDCTSNSISWGKLSSASSGAGGPPFRIDHDQSLVHIGHFWHTPELQFLLCKWNTSAFVVGNGRRIFSLRFRGCIWYLTLLQPLSVIMLNMLPIYM